MSGIRAALNWQLSLLWISAPVQRIIAALGSWTATAVLSLAVGALLMARAWFPVEAIYLDARALYVPQIVAGSEPVVVLDRVIHRQFDGRWDSRVHSIAPSGAVAECERSGAGPYLVSSTLPEPLTIRWLIGDACADYLSATPGFYTASISWEVMVPVIGPVSVNLTSNVFEVTP